MGCKVLSQKPVGRQGNVVEWAGQQTLWHGGNAGRVPVLPGATDGLSDSYLGPPTPTHTLAHTPTLLWQPVMEQAPLLQAEAQVKRLCSLKQANTRSPIGFYVDILSDTFVR